MTRILLSLLTIAAFVGLSTAATLAYFTDTETVANNQITTAGNLDFTVVMTDVSGATVPSLVENDMRPGQSTTRCLWIRNAGEVPGRYKLYRSGPEVGDFALGDALRMSATLNPTTGNCSGLSRPADFTDPLVYGPNNIAKLEWQDVKLRSGNFDSSSNTPYLIKEEEPAMDPGYYSLFAITVTLPGTVDSTLADKSFTTAFTLFGMQKEGSDFATPPASPAGWNTTQL